MTQTIEWMAGVWFSELWLASWQFAVLVLGVWLLCRCFGGLSSQVRYWLWCIALLRLCLPLGYVASLGLLPLDWLGASETFVNPFPAILPALSAAPSLPSSEGGVVPVTMSWVGALFLCWLVCCVGLLLAMFWQSLQVSRQLRASRMSPSPGLRALFASLLEKAEVSQRVRLLVSDAPCTLGGPFVRGFVQFEIVLPAKMVSTWSLEELEPILLHELTHIQRKDLYVHVLQAFLQILYCFHPLVWFVNRRIVQAREMACDDQALLLFKDRRKVYAETLLRVAESQLVSSHRDVLMSHLVKHQSLVSKRIKRMLAKKYPGYQKIRKSTHLLLLGFALAALASCTLGSGRVSTKKSKSLTLIGQSKLVNVRYQRVQLTLRKLGKHGTKAAAMAAMKKQRFWCIETSCP